MTKRKHRYIIFTLTILIGAGCGTTGESAGGAGPGGAGPRGKSGPYYTGDGGKGLSLAVLNPTGNGLSQAENYLPALVQGVLAGDFTKFSAMEIFDRQNLDKIAAEMESGIYAESDDIVKYGQKVPAGYLLTGELIKSGGGYLIKLAVSDTKTGAVKASYSGSADRRSIDDFSAIKKASEEILAQLGINLTDAGRQALYGTSEKTVEAETALARGVSEERGGSIVAAYTYLTEAASLNAGLPEADARLAALTKQIETGNLGEDIRNDIALRAAWKKLLDDALVFYEENPPFNVVFRDKPITGKINYEKNTAELSFEFWLEPNARLLALRKLLLTLEITGKMDEWGFYHSYFQKLVRSYDENTIYEMSVKAELIDGEGEFLAASREGDYSVTWLSPFRSLERLSFPTASLITFAVDAQKISGDMRLVFTAAGKVGRGKNSVPGMIKNALGNTLIKATDKPWHEYFSGKRNYELAPNGRFGTYTFPG